MCMACLVLVLPSTHALEQPAFPGATRGIHTVLASLIDAAVAAPRKLVCTAGHLWGIHPDGCWRLALVLLLSAFATRTCISHIHALRVPPVMHSVPCRGMHDNAAL